MKSVLDFKPGLFEGKRVLVLRGKWKGRIHRVHQSANDWVMLDEAADYDVVSVRSIRVIKEAQ